MIPALADPVVAVTAKTAARPRRAARRPSAAAARSLGTTCTRFGAGDEACGTAAAGFSPTTLEFTAAIIALELVDRIGVAVRVRAWLLIGSQGE